MRLRFTKMQGLGNDFVVIDGVRQRVAVDAARARTLADRHFGVGCDQILLVEAAAEGDADFGYRIFNADGGEVEQCGNGARCFARFVHDKGLSRAREIRVRTRGGIIVPRLEEDGRVTVDMGVPQFEPERVPFLSESRARVQPLGLGEETVYVTALSMGNPHAVQVVADLDAAPVAEQGARIACHERFPKGVNAGYMQVLDAHRIGLRVFERGAGETLACGSGACAAVAAGIVRGLLESPVRARMRGGELDIAWDGEGAPVRMSGPAVTVFEGEIEIP
ncbi:MAG: diaminopimelate epimerase [Rhodocyclaceae bacterium]